MKKFRTTARFARLLRFSIYGGFVPTSRPNYPKGRLSIDPELMIRDAHHRLLPERAICWDVQVNLVYRWFCGLSIEDKIPDHSAFHVPVMSGSATAI
jgi:hypothetical protein